MITFGTAGLRGPMQDGPDGMNVETVERATWAVASVLTQRCLGGATVVVGRDARHNSDDFALAAAEVFAAAGFSVVLLPDPLPTPVVAFAVRHLGAAAGVQITASHNPATDNGYKVYFDGGMQIISPTDRDIEAAMRAAPAVITRESVQPTDTELVEQYLDRAAAVRRDAGAPVRVALTALHGVGGTVALEAFRRAGITDVHTVATQFWPDPDFPTVAFPNPEEPGATDAVLALAADVGADLAIALDPDADRCAVGIPTETGWRMLSGDETGWLLGDHVLSQAGEGALVASTVVSSQMLASIAEAHGARHVETLTGFKWLARADSDTPGHTLVYAYEEAIGHCVDPTAVRDKDGISAAVLACDLVASLKAQGSSVPQALDALFVGHGVHLTAAATERVGDAAAVMVHLRGQPPTALAGVEVTVTDLLDRRGAHRTDALMLTGPGVRVAIRPSGTEPKIKGYIEISSPPTQDVAAARAHAQELLAAVTADVTALLRT